MTSQNSKGKSVLVLTHNFPRHPGDVSGVFLKHLIDKLSDSVDFTILAPHDKGLPEVETDDGLEIHRFRYASDDDETLAYRGEIHTYLKKRPLAILRFIRSYRKTAIRLAHESSPDLIWAHWWVPGGWVGMKAKGESHIPLIVTCHGTDVFLLNKFTWIRGLAAKVFRAAKRITVVSSFLKDQLVDVLRDKVDGIEDKIVVVPMPVNADAFFYDEKIEPESGSIISASRLTSQKHLDKLVHAVSKLAEDGVRFKLDIYGDGPERDNLQRLIESLNLEDRVSIHRSINQKELAEKYRRSQIAVLASEREGFGLMLLEAMICGCVGIGANSGGITDIIDNDGKDGILVEPGDVDSLYGSLKRLLSDEALIKKLRDSCRKSAEARFSSDAIAQKFLDVLDRQSE